MKTKRDSAMAQELIPAYHDQEPSGSLYQSLLQLGMEPARQDWLSTAIPALHRKRRRMMGHVRDANGQVVFSYPLTPPEHHHANGLLPCPLSELSFMKDQAVLQLNLLNHLQSEIIDYSEEMIDNLFGLSADSTEASPAIPLPSLLRYIMARTQLPVTTLVIALIYLKRLKSLHPACRGSRSSSPRVLFAALILACKFTTDDPFDNKAWSTVSCGLFGIAEVTRMEREMLYFLDYKLNVSKTEWVQFVGELGRCMSRSLRDKQQRLLQSSGSYEMFGRSSPVPGPHSLFMAPIPSGPLYQVPQFVPPPKENCAPHVPVDDLSRSSSGQTLFEARFSSESMEYDGSMYPQLTFSHLSKSNPWTYPTP